MKVIDLFCGAGGFSHGFQMEGFDIILGIDNWKGCKETYEHNHPNTEFLLMEMNDLQPCTLPKAEVIIGSPPCTNFSVVNPHKDESKGYALVDKFLEIVEACEPTYWIMENVPNKHLIDHLNGFPYMVVRCSDFGLHTMRKRLFAGMFPQPFSMGYKPWRLNRDVYPTISSDRYQGHRNNSVASFRNDDAERMRKSWERRNVVFGSIPANPRKGVGQYAWQHEQWEKRGVVFPTVSGRNVAQRGATGSKEAFNKRGIDAIEFTPEFAAWVQTFPDDFKFIGSKTSKYKMIGNAVPPEMSRILARAIMEDYDGN